MVLELAATLSLVLANAFFVGTEFAIARLRPTQVAELEREGAAGAASMRHALDHIDSYLSACQLGITLASIGLGVVGKPFFEERLEPLLGAAAGVGGFAVAAALAFSIVTLLHVVVGELAPKSLAIARTVTTARLVAPPMRLFYLATRPVVELFNAMGNMLLKPFGVPPARQAGHAPHSEDELRDLLKESAARGLIDPEERRLTENVFSFGDRRAREIMVPRPAVRYVTTADSVADVARRSLETGFTRFPLCTPEDGLDAAFGLVHVKDLLATRLDGRQLKLRELARPIPRVPESILVDELLRELRRDHQHVALVVDEHGTVVGLVSLEDLLEEIVGEIEDEFDNERHKLIAADADRVRIAGAAPLGLVAEEIGLTIPDHHSATIGGHVLELLGRVPEVGEVIELEGRQVQVTRVAGAHIEELTVRHPADPFSPPEEPPTGRTD
jgi:CBS domain containing-hemolysin-like protein